MNAHSNKETTELIAAAAVVVIRAKKAAPGGFSWLELIGFASDWPVLKHAFEGIDRVDDELLDLNADETKQIGEQIAAFMVELGLPHRSSDVTQELIDLAGEAVRVWQRIVALPPIPEVVP